MSSLSNLDMWNLVVGFALPNLIAVIQQPRWSSRIRACVTGAVCVVAGLVSTLLAGTHLDFGRALVTSILTVAVAAVSFYKHFWVPTGIAPAVEHATSPRSARHRNT